MPPDPRFKRGAKPSPKDAIARAPAFRPRLAAPPQAAYVPSQLSVWGNDIYGDCVTAEEAFAKACHNPIIMLDDKTVIGWARSHGYLNGADLVSVLDSMQADGFVVGPQRYNDGRYFKVDYRNADTLAAALATGPVKIAIDADALPDGAGNHQGWYALGRGRFPNTDHCVSVCGFGPAGWLYQQLGVPLPTALKADQPGYLLFTWATIGFVDLAWLLSTCTEAWVRNPTTVGVPPLGPEPGPNPPADVPIVIPAGTYTAEVGDGLKLTPLPQSVAALKRSLPGWSLDQIFQFIQFLIDLLRSGEIPPGMEKRRGAAVGGGDDDTAGEGQDDGADTEGRERDQPRGDDDGDGQAGGQAEQPRPRPRGR